MYVAYKAHLTALVHIRRHVLGHKQRSQWHTAQDMQATLPALLDDWEGKVRAVGLNKDTTATVQASTDRPLSFWRRCQVLPSILEIDTDKDTIKRLLHGTRRHEFRKQINTHVRKREILRREVKWRTVLASLLGELGGRKHQQGVDLDTVED